jgi:hypothetical protein
MRRFFIGGSPELEDVTYAKQPAGTEDVCHDDVILSLLLGENKNRKIPHDFHFGHKHPQNI